MGRASKSKESPAGTQLPFWFIITPFVLSRTTAPSRTLNAASISTTGTSACIHTPSVYRYNTGPDRASSPSAPVQGSGWFTGITVRPLPGVPPPRAISTHCAPSHRCSASSENHTSPVRVDAGSDGTTGMDDCTHPVSVYVYCAAPEIRVAPGLAPVGNASKTGSSGVTNGADAAKHRDTRGGIPNNNSDPVSVTSNTRPPPASVTVATTSATSD